MTIAKRVFLFLIVNILIVTTLSILMSVLGVQPYLTGQGLDIASLTVFCLVWGFGGAFISLALSRVMAKWIMGVRLIKQDSGSSEQWIVDMVRRISTEANLPKVPEVGIFESDSPNAFATGPTKSRALVAVSTGLLRQMNRNEVEGVLAHEIAHIANGDMVTLTLIQGVVNAFVMFFARIIAWSLAQMVEGEKRGMIQFATTMVLEIAFSLLGMIVVAAFSRHREFRADRGGAQLVGSSKMVSALVSLRNSVEGAEKTPSSLAAFQISSGKGRGLLALISTHPPLDERIRRLQSGQ